MKNCLTYALTKWYKEGGYLVIRKSKYVWWVPHFLHMTEKGLITQYVPKNIPKNPLRRLLHLWSFSGQEVYGDD